MNLRHPQRGSGVKCLNLHTDFFRKIQSIPIHFYFSVNINQVFYSLASQNEADPLQILEMPHLMVFVSLNIRQGVPKPDHIQNVQVPLNPKHCNFFQRNSNYNQFGLRPVSKFGTY